SWPVRPRRSAWPPAPLCPPPRRHTSRSASRRQGWRGATQTPPRRGTKGEQCRWNEPSPWRWRRRPPARPLLNRQLRRRVNGVGVLLHIARRWFLLSGPDIAFVLAHDGVDLVDAEIGGIRVALVDAGVVAVGLHRLLREPSVVDQFRGAIDIRPEAGRQGAGALQGSGDASVLVGEPGKQAE